MGTLKILVVGDGTRMRKLIKDFLIDKRFTAVEMRGGEEAMNIFFTRRDIAPVLLDAIMSKMGGWEVLRTIRKYSQVPVTMLTARSEERDELQGSSLGTDKHISKPFGPKILVVRVETIFRRTNVASADSVSMGGTYIDKTTRQVTMDEQRIDLNFREFKLLTCFMKNWGVVPSREKVLSDVWNYDYFGDTHTIDTHVRRLRSRMGEEGEHIKTMWGMDYKLEVSEG